MSRPIVAGETSGRPYLRLCPSALLGNGCLSHRCALAHSSSELDPSGYEYYRVRTAYCCADYVSAGSCERTDCIFVHKHQLLVEDDGGTCLPSYPHAPSVMAEVARATSANRVGLLQRAYSHDYQLSCRKFYNGGDAFVPTAERDGFVAVAARRSCGTAHLPPIAQPAKSARPAEIRKQPSIRKFFPLTRLLSVRHAAGHPVQHVELTEKRLRERPLPKNVHIDGKHDADCPNAALRRSAAAADDASSESPMPKKRRTY